MAPPLLPHFRICWLKTAYVIWLLICWFQSSFAYGDVYVVNSTLIYDACGSSCETSQVDQILIGDCQRGCRLFDTLIIQNSIFAQVDEAIALPNCQHSCSEAYGIAISAVTACFDGCTNAQREYHARSVKLLQYIREIQRNLTFFEWFPRRPEKINNFGIPSTLKSGKSGESVRHSEQALDTTPHNLNDLNPDSSQMSFLPNLNQLPSVDDQSKRRGTSKQSTTTPNWMVHSALAVFVLGVIMVMAACCYCCIFGQHHITKYMPSRSKSIDSDLPPSYEHLMGNTV